MLSITKENNSIRVEATDYSFYPFNGVVTYPSNSVIVVTDKSNMATFKSSTNGDVLFVGNINELTIDGNKVTKDTIVGEFTKIANASASVDAYTKAESDAKLDKKQDIISNGNNYYIWNPLKDYGYGEDKNYIDSKFIRVVGYSSSADAASADSNTNNIAIGAYSSVRGRLMDDGGRDTEVIDSIAIGYNTKAYGLHSVAIGDEAQIGGYYQIDGYAHSYCVAINGSVGNGYFNKSLEYGVAINGSTDSNNSIAINANIGEYAEDSIAIGKGVNIGDNYGDHAVVIGANAAAEYKNCVSIGYKAYADKDNPLSIKAGGDNSSDQITMIQGSKEGKISIPLGDGTTNRMVIQDEINALKAGGSGGTVDAYTKAETDEKLAKKQDKLVAGSNITLTENTADGTVTIASTGGSGGTVDAYTKAESDAKYALKTDHDTLAGEVTTLTTNKQDKLTAGTGITIDGNTISATGGGSGSVSGLTIDDKKVTAGFNQEIGVGGESTPPDGIVAIGKGAVARLDYVTAVGFKAMGQGTSATAVGDRSNAAAALSTAIGYDATANDTSAIALGDSASAGGYSSIAIGQNANASGRVSIALGDDSKATVDNPLVINAGEYKDKTCITMIKGSSVGKISIPAGDGSKVRMVLQDEINSLKSEVATLKSQLVTLTNKLNTINGEDI